LKITDPDFTAEDVYDLMDWLSFQPSSFPKE
jgi:hypothetical protein